MACKKPIITANSVACEEILQDKVNCLFCQTASGRDLATKVLELKNNKNLREGIAKAGYECYLKNLTPKLIGAKLKSIIENK